LKWPNTHICAVGHLNATSGSALIGTNSSNGHLNKLRPARATAVSKVLRLKVKSRSSAVGIKTAKIKNLHFSVTSRPALQAPNLMSNGYRGALSLEIKQQGREADHSPPTSAQVK
jgi:hypothetical protein